MGERLRLGAGSHLVPPAGPAPLLGMEGSGQAQHSLASEHLLASVIRHHPPSEIVGLALQYL